jgi:hypothetical protein
MKSFEQKLLGRLYCFCGGGNDDPGGDAAQAEQEAYDAGGGGYTGADDFGFSDDTIGGYEGDGDTGGTEPGGGGDAFDASSSYVNQAITNFQASPAAQQSVGVMATPMSAATVGAGFNAPAPSVGGGGDDDRARIEAEEAARFEAEIEAEAARQEAREAEEARLSSPESLTDDQLDEAIAAYSNASTAVASEVLGRLVEEKEIRTVEKAEEAENQRLLDQKQEFEEAEIESSDLPGSNVGISLGDLMAQYGVPSDKITYGIDGIPVIDLGMTTKEIDAIYGGDDQPEKPTTTQQIIDYATQKAIKTLDANEDGEVSALEFVAPFAVGASGLGTFNLVNALVNEAGITDKNIIDEIISSVEDGIESLIGFAIPKVGDPTEIDTPVTDLSMTTAEIDALQGGLDTPVTDLPPVPTSTEQSFAVPDFALGITGKEIKGPQVRQDELDRAIQEEIDADRLAEEAENQRRKDQEQEFEEAETFLMDSMSAFDQSPAGGSTTGPDPLSNVEMQNRIIQNSISGSGGFATGPSGVPGISILRLGGREYSFDNTVPADQRSYTEISGSSIIDAAPDMISNLPKDTAEDEAIPVTDLSMTTAEIDALSSNASSNIASMDSMDDDPDGGGNDFNTTPGGGYTASNDGRVSFDVDEDEPRGNQGDNRDDNHAGGGGSGFDIPVTDLSMTTAEIDALSNNDSMDDDPVTGDFGVNTGSGQIGGLDQGAGDGGSDDNDGNDDDVDEVESVQYTPTVYTFGEPTTFTPTESTSTEDLTYREPAITSPFDFARDFGYYTLSPEIADSYVTKELQSYVPTYLKPIGEMTPEEIEELIGIRSIIGPNYPVQTQPIGYPFTTTPEEEAEALLPKE